MYVTKLALVVWLFIHFSQTTYIGHKQVGNDTIIPVTLFAKPEADKILGAPTHLTDSVQKKETTSSSYLCGYKADKEDAKTGKTGVVYFLFEEYNSLDSATKRLSDVYLSNRANGMVKMNNLGDEAVYHTDNENFDLVMVRKGRYVFNIKINKRTSTSSMSELKKIAYRITKKI